MAVICYGFLADIHNPFYLRLGFFLASVTTLATLYDMYDRKAGDKIIGEKVDNLLNDVRAIAKSYSKEAKLNLIFSSPKDAEISSAFVDLVSIEKDLERKIPEIEKTIADNFLSQLIRLNQNFEGNTEERRTYKIKYALWEYRTKGIYPVKLSIVNDGDIAADKIDLFLYIPRVLNPLVTLPKKPYAPAPFGLILPDKFIPPLGIHWHVQQKSEHVQIHWEIPSLNPEIVQALDVFYIEPGKSDGAFELKYSVSTSASKGFKGVLKLNVKKAEDITQVP